MAFFEKVPLAPPDPIFGLTVAFQKDPRSHKVNLGAGIYKTEDLKTPVLSSVKAAEAALLDSEKSKEYLPIDGERDYLDLMGALVFGKEKWEGQKERIAAFQTIGGTGALKIGGTLIKQEAESSVWISTPTWPNHRGVFTDCGLKVEKYPYYDSKGHRLDFENMIACLEKMPEGTVVVLHASCHNPTGCDPTDEQWKTICASFKKNKLLAFFDFAYQGFGEGIEQDAAPVRQFLQSDLEFLAAVSNAKNLGLYGERAGCLFIVSSSPNVTERVISRVKQLIRTNYSNPPIHGARVAAYVLGTSSLRKKWEGELSEMRDRINEMRLAFHDRLMERSKTFDFSHLKKGRGMFAFTGLSKDQVDRMREEFAIYMPSDGRINLCGITRNNLDVIVDATVKVVVRDKNS